MDCPKCNADISESYEPDDPSVGVVGGYYCDACDLAVGDDHEPREDDVPIMTAKEFRGDQPLGVPISMLSGRAVPPDHPDYWKFENWKRFCKSNGYD